MINPEDQHIKKFNDFHEYVAKFWQRLFPKTFFTEVKKSIVALKYHVSVIHPFTRSMKNEASLGLRD